MAFVIIRMSIVQISFNEPGRLFGGISVIAFYVRPEVLENFFITLQVGINRIQLGFLLARKLRTSQDLIIVINIRQLSGYQRY